MAEVLSRKVYQIDNDLYDGCDMNFPCGKFIVIQSDYQLKLFDPAEGTCNADPQFVNVEIVIYNGRVYYIAKNTAGEGLTEECLKFGPVIEITIDKDQGIFVPGNLVYRVALQPTATSTIQLGTTVGGDQIMLSEVIAGTAIKTVVKDIIGPVTIYPTGIISPTKFWIYTDPL